jgi:hypothetical protein
MIGPRTHPSSLGLVAALLVACGSSKQDTPAASQNAPPVRSTSPTDQASDTGEPRAISHSNGRIRRQGPTLEIQVGNSRVVALTDDTTEGGSAIAYRYDRHLDPLPFHGIRTVFYEGSGYLLVHDSTGRQTYLDVRPEIAPDGTGWVTASFDLVAQFDPNRVVIGRIVGDTIAVDWSTAPTEWGPEGMRWVSKDSIRFTEQWATDRPDSTVPRPALVVRTPTGWKLIDSEHP